MMHKRLLILVVLTVALGLWVIQYASAGAQDSVEDLTITPTPNTANQPAAYEIAFTTSSSGTLSAWVDMIIITFPPETQMPGTISFTDVTIDGIICNGGTLAGHTLALNIPQTIGARQVCQVLIDQAAGVINPQISQELGDLAPDDPYEITVSTTADPVEVSAAYEIFDWVSVDKHSFTFSEIVTVTGAGFWPATSVTLNGLAGGPLTGSAQVEPDGTVAISAFITGVILEDLEASDGSGRKTSIPADEFTLLPRLSITPDEGTICREVVITGYDYHSGTPSGITIGGQVLYDGVITMTDLDGDSFNDDFRVIGVQIPRNLSGGLYQVVCQDAATYFDVDSRQVTITPPAGPPETNITIEGTGFCPGDNFGFAVMMYGNTTIGGYVTSNPIVVDDQGTFATIGKIPDTASSGLHGVLIVFDPDMQYDPVDPEGDQIITQGMFTVTDRHLTIVPDDIPFGTTVTLSGGDFGSQAAGKIPELWVNYQQQYEIGFDPLSSSGDIVPRTFKITSDLGFHYGENILQLEVDIDEPPDGNPDMTASTTLNVVRPTLEIEPTQGPRGTKVTATGSGWLTGQTDFIEIGYQKDGSETAVTIIRANEAGNIWAQFDIPLFQMGTQMIDLVFYAHDYHLGNESLPCNFEVIAPKIWVVPEAAPIGTDVTVFGEGFQPKTQIQEVSIGNAPIIPVYELGLTDSQGEFEITGTVPGIMPGTQTVRARVTQAPDEPVTYPFIVGPGPPDDPTAEVGLASIDGLYTTLWTFDAQKQEWQVYQPDLPPWVPVFSRLNSGQGYWINVTEDCTLTYGANTWNLKTTWNLIGWLD